MKIKSCEIKNFGKLSDKTLDLSDGITVIRGDNESGKSTVSAFIKYILYGFYGKGRDETSNEKLKYTPWNGTKCAGALLLEDSDGTLYRAERSGDGKSAKGKILNSQGSECFEGYSAGEAFYGTDVSAFTKSTFVGQDDIMPDDMKELTSSLEKLIMQGDKDDTDFDKAAKTLGGERNKLYNRMRNTGKILELEARIAELKRKRAEESDKNSMLNSVAFSLEEAEKSLSEVNLRLEGLYSEAENIEAYRAGELLEKIEKAKLDSDTSKDVYEKAKEEFSVNSFVPDRAYIAELDSTHSEYLTLYPEYLSAKKELEKTEQRYKAESAKIQKEAFSDKDIENNDNAVNELFEKAGELQGGVQKLKKLLILFICLVVTIPIALVVLVLYSKKKTALGELLSEYGFSDYAELEKYVAVYNEVFPMLSEIRMEKATIKEYLEQRKTKLSECSKQLSDILQKYDCDGDFETSPEYLKKIGSEIIPKIQGIVYKLEELYGIYSENQRAYNALVSVSDVENLLLLASKKQNEPPKRPKQEVDRAIKYDEGAKDLLVKRISEYKTKIAGLSASVTDPADIENEVYNLSCELSCAKEHLDAIELAIELIEKSANDIRGDAFPKISERAGELFSKFTDGKYRNLFFDKDFAIKVLESEDTETRRIGFLSSGATDTAYIALRVALAEYLCKDKPTLIFDDSFAKIDSGRLENILDVLLTLSKECQIIILTCHTREEQLLCGKCKALVLD